MIARIDLPYAKPPLSMNDRQHWAVKARITAGVRDEYRTARKSRQRPDWPSARDRHALLPTQGKPQTRRRQPRSRPQSLLRRTRRPRTHRRRHTRPHDQSDARHPPSRQRPTARTLARNRMEHEMTDPVNHPAHYTEHPSGIECIQITEHMGFNLGNAVKYIWRADLKGSAIQDLEKARWYIDRELVKRGEATEPAEDLRVHNHTPYRGPGPDGHCAERTENGRLRGQCMTEIARTVGRCPKELEGDIESFPCVLSAGHRERCKSAGGLTWGYFTPAEPAEEETKAEQCAVRLCVLPARHSGVHADREGLRWNNPTSSPVVPAPTETGPWKHRVNGEICVASPASGLPYTIGKFNDHGNFVWHSSSTELPEGFAPFVAAEEG